MLSGFEFATPARIIFGSGAVRQIGTLAAALGKRALVVTGRTTGRVEPILASLGAAHVACEVFRIPGEPTTSVVREGVDRAKACQTDLVIGFGGGSALDGAKAISALLTNPGDLLDYLEVVGLGKTLTKPAAPYIAIPTTAGTGTEVTRNAVLASPEHRVKASLRSPLMLPRIALVDPELTRGLPREITATTGLDALTQLIEPYVCLRANPLTDALCMEGMSRVARSLQRAWQDGQDMAAREDMAVASLFGGFALANAGLGAVHGFAAPIGGMFPAPHGAVCAALLPHVMSANLAALRTRMPSNPAVSRYDTVARILTGHPGAGAEDGVLWVRQLCHALSIPGLGAYGITPDAFPILVEKAAQASSMKANPIALSPDELSQILVAAL